MRTLHVSVLVVLCGCVCQETLSLNLSKIVKPWTNDRICGTQHYAPNTVGRVAGGDIANPHSWPWQARIMCRTSANASLCGGSIISDRWIITAAHCIQTQIYKISKDCTVSLGAHYLASMFEATGKTFRIADYVLHDHYNPDDLELGFDLALVKLSRRIKYTKEILPICLPFDQPELTYSSVCYSSGWGYTEGNRSSASQVLKQIRVPIQADEYCTFTSRSAKLGIIVCAGMWGRAQNLCYGDSGGPLECKSADSKWYLHGVLSQVDNSCVSVASFTKVRKYQNWIEKYLNRS